MSPENSLEQKRGNRIAFIISISILVILILLMYLT